VSVREIAMALGWYTERGRFCMHGVIGTNSVYASQMYAVKSVAAHWQPAKLT